MSARRIFWLIAAGISATLTVKVGLWACGPAGDRGDFDVQGRHGELRAPEVALITRGIEPREALRLAPREGAVRRWTIRSREDARLDTAGERVSKSEIEYALDVRGRVGDVGDDGSFAWRWKVVAARVLSSRSEGRLGNPGQATRVASLEGLRGTSIVDPRGFVLRSTLDGGGGDAGRELRQGVAHVLGEPTLHLPAEAVGERAIWEVRRRDVRQGIEVEEVERYELMERSRDRLEIRLRSRGSAEPQGIDEFLGGLMATTLQSYSSEGHGDWTFAIEGSLDLGGEGGREERLLAEQSFQGLPMAIEVTTRAEISIDPLE